LKLLWKDLYQNNHNQGNDHLDQSNRFLLLMERQVKIRVLMLNRLDQLVLFNLKMFKRASNNGPPEVSLHPPPGLSPRRPHRLPSSDPDRIQGV
jgi:hypothetical protein